MLYGKKINAVPRTKTPEQALAALMRLCARAERSEEDARRLMTRWGVKKLCPICFATLDVCRKSLACFSLLNIP